ncbi:MAG: septal ring lytic transglycosylase RlpA family protein [Micromonosporaceae bacterium]|nr:septal ring lytic transglycosylase RlpA family protein [Micromonosporaceae bacterium]
MNLGGPRSPAQTTAADAPATAAGTPAPSPQASRSIDQPASRGELRALPTPSPSRTSPRPTPTQPSGGGTVASTGTCQASYYDTGTTTASGEPFDPNALTAAHKTLAFGTQVRVTNTANGESVVVRINDRGPFVSGRCLDLTTAAFKAIASLSAGVVTVRYQVLT